MINKLVIVTNIDSVSLVKDYLSEPNTFIFTLDSAVQAWLTQKEYSYVNLIPFYGKAGHQSIINISTQIIRELEPAFSHISRKNVKNTFNSSIIFWSRFVINQYLIYLYIINSVVKSMNIKEFVVLDHGSKNNSSLLISILSLYASSNEIRMKSLKYNYSIEKHEPKLNNLVEMLLFVFFKTKLKYFTKKKPTILAAGTSHSMPELIHNVQQLLPTTSVVYFSSNPRTILRKLKDILSGRVTIFPNTTSFLTKKDINEIHLQVQIMNEIVSEKIKNQPGIFQFCGVNLQNLITNHLIHTIEQTVYLLHRRVKGMQSIMQIIDNPIAAFSQHALGQFGALGEICYKYKIPALLITHGSHVPHENDQYAKLEWSYHAKTMFNAYFEFVAIQTPWADHFYNQEKILCSAPIITGPLLFAKKLHNSSSREELRKRLFTNHIGKKIILHAGSPKGWEYNRPWVYETIDEYIRNINHMIESVEKVKDLYLAIRFRPIKELSLDSFKILIKKSECYDIYVDGNFGELLEASDLLASYSSTAIEEALQFEMPVLQYDPDNKYSHLPGQLLKNGLPVIVSQLYCVNNHSDLTWAFNWLVKNHFTKGTSLGSDYKKNRYQKKNIGIWLKEMRISNVYNETK